MTKIEDLAHDLAELAYQHTGKAFHEDDLEELSWKFLMKIQYAVEKDLEKRA